MGIRGRQRASKEAGSARTPEASCSRSWCPQRRAGSSTIDQRRGTHAGAQRVRSGGTYGGAPAPRRAGGRAVCRPHSP